MAKHFLNKKKKKKSNNGYPTTTPATKLPKKASKIVGTAKTIKHDTHRIPVAAFAAQYKKANPDVLVCTIDPDGPPVEMTDESTGRVYLLKEGRVFVKGVHGMPSGDFLEYID